MLNSSQQHHNFRNVMLIILLTIMTEIDAYQQFNPNDGNASWYLNHSIRNVMLISMFTIVIETRCKSIC